MELTIRNLLTVIYMFPLMNFNGKVFYQAQLVVNSTQETSNFIMKSGYFFKKKSTKSSRILDQCGFHNFFTPGDGDFPWIALILYKEFGNENYSVSCNGNLISNRHILTAGYCVKPYGIEQSIDRMLVIIGNYDVQRWLDGKDSRNYTVKAYDVHPEAATSASKWDIAVVTLAAEVIYKTFIRPICLWSGRTGSEEIEEIVGMLSGWTISDRGEILTPKSTQTTLPVVLQGKCSKSDFLYDSYSPTKTFCTEYKYGSTNLCSDITSSRILGAGLMTKKNRRWSLRGIFTMGTSLSCEVNLRKYLVFIDVSQFTNWILFTIFKTVPTRTSSLNEICGKSLLTTSVIADGRSAAKGYYPWMVALYNIQQLNLQWICSGSLVSAKHVTTAAHCLRPYEKQVNIDQLLLILGKYNIERWINDKNSLKLSVETVSIHPDYRDSSADADVAVITLTEQVRFNSFIRPICLWSDSTNLKETEGDIGVVTGWGKDKNGRTLTTEPKQISMPIVSQEECLNAHDDLRAIISERTFCAGNKNSSGPCTGDGGGGFMMYRNRRWILRGILSKSIASETGNCDLNQYLVFTDVSKFSTWILTIINK